MCFSFQSSVIMSVIGLIASVILYRAYNFPIAFTVFYFTLMEIIQAIGYKVLDNCENKLNKAMAYLNYIHISFQPFIFTLFIFSILKFYNLTKYSQITLVLYLSLVASIFLLSRLFGPKETSGCDLCGPKACVKSGNRHITIETPLRTKPEYMTPNIFVHFFFFFIPPLFLGPYGIGLAIFTFLGFVVLTKSMKLANGEASTVWCFASVVQLILIIILAAFFSKIKPRP